MDFLMFVLVLFGVAWLLWLMVYATTWIWAWYKRWLQEWNWLWGDTPAGYEQSGRPSLYNSVPWPKSSLPPPEPKMPVVRLKRYFGRHRNPLVLESGECLSAFEQMDERTWQCPLCGLLRFERFVGEAPMEATSLPTSLPASSEAATPPGEVS